MKIRLCPIFAIGMAEIKTDEANQAPHSRKGNAMDIQKIKKPRPTTNRPKALRTPRLRELVCTYRTPAGYQPQALHTSGDVSRYLADLAAAIAEHLIVIPLTNRNEIVCRHTVAVGSGNCCHVEPAAILRPVLLSGADRFILAHNHPSGDPAPSPEDLALTRRIRSAAQIVGLEILDHVVIGRMDDSAGRPLFQTIIERI